MTSEPYLSTSEAAKLLGVSVQTVRNWANDGRIRHVRMPSGRTRYLRSDLVALLTPVEPVAKSS